MFVDVKPPPSSLSVAVRLQAMPPLKPNHMDEVGQMRLDDRWGWIGDIGQIRLDRWFLTGEVKCRWHYTGEIGKVRLDRWSWTAEVGQMILHIWDWT